jgi:hypothetical protein
MRFDSSEMVGRFAFWVPTRIWSYWFSSRKVPIGIPSCFDDGSIPMNRRRDGKKGFVLVHGERVGAPITTS